MSDGRPSLLELDANALQQRVVQLGGKPFHARILREQVVASGTLDYDELTSLPKDLRRKLAAELPIFAGEELKRLTTSDATTKLLIGFSGGSSVETVYIPSHKADKGATLCVSTQVGCPVACPFCASGLAGLVRNLSSSEIVEQFLRGRALGPLARAVVMGIGEPLLNYPELERALDVVHDELGLGARKVTVSTVGFPDRLRRVARQKPRFQLAISLHTPDDEQRDRLVPAMAGTPIEDVLAAGDDWFEVTGREITYEYVLLGGVNDSDEHATRLAERLARRRCTVNLIPFNPSPDLPYKRPRPADVDGFAARLTELGIVATVRWSRGLEGDAACGQLRYASR